MGMEHSEIFIGLNLLSLEGVTYGLPVPPPGVTRWLEM